MITQILTRRINESLIFFERAMSMPPLARWIMDLIMRYSVVQNITLCTSACPTSGYDRNESMLLLLSSVCQFISITKLPWVYERVCLCSRPRYSCIHLSNNGEVLQYRLCKRSQCSSFFTLYTTFTHSRPPCIYSTIVFSRFVLFVSSAAKMLALVLTQNATKDAYTPFVSFTLRKQLKIN